VILYFTCWYPSEYRGRVISTLFIAQAGRQCPGVDRIGGGSRHGRCPRPRQWVFIIEALPAIGLAFVVWFVMTDSPAVADWLDV
jgi:ACS family tartrate transporter-like MFS transporter